MERIRQLYSYEYIHYKYVLGKMIHRCKKSKCLFLDAGCGKRFTYRSQLSNDTKFVGVDVLRANVVSSKRENRDFDYVIADLTKMPFIEGVFDGVLCIDVLEHVKEKKEVVYELSRVTKKGGFFIGCTTNLLNPILLLDAKFPKITEPLVTKYAPGHYERHSRLNISDVHKIFTKKGYQVNYFTLLGFPQFNTRIYKSQIKGVPWIAYLWILFDRITKYRPLLFLKEIIVWQATRN